MALLDDLLHKNGSIKDSLFVEDVLVQVVLLLVKMKRRCEANVSFPTRKRYKLHRVTKSAEGGKTRP